MKPAELAKRLQWFDDGAAALRRVFPEAPVNAYCCPLCLRFFIRNSVVACVLTVEHVPARSVGGRPILLTCKLCNSVAGSALESKLKQADAVGRFGMPDSVPIPAVWTVGGVVNRGMTRFDGATIEHYGIPKRNDVRDLDALRSALEQMGHGSEIDVTISHEPDLMVKAARAWMRSAYLAAFAIFGYRYILRAPLASIRAAIDGDGPTTVLKLKSDHGIGVLLIDGPDSLAGCLGVVQHRTLALLPGFGSAGERLLDDYTRALLRNSPAVPLEWTGGWDWPTRALYLADRQ